MQFGFLPASLSSLFGRNLSSSSLEIAFASLLQSSIHVRVLPTSQSAFPGCVSISLFYASMSVISSIIIASTSLKSFKISSEAVWWRLTFSAGRGMI